MRSLLLTFAFVVALGTVSFADTADAWMLNFEGEGFKQTENCTPFKDHPVYNTIDGKAVQIGCIEQTAWERAKEVARILQETGFRFGAGEIVTLITGAKEMCPEHYNPMGCVIDKAQVLR